MPSLDSSENFLNSVRADLHRALREDIGEGDVTSRNTLPAAARLQGKFIAKAAGVVAGLEVAAEAFRLLDPAVEFNPAAGDGDSVESGTVIAELKGNGIALLSGERVALNFLQRMSGIATRTRQYVQAVSGSRAIILDTRKTAPGLRHFDKRAVKIGGGQNHRFGLFDMILIKENHIAAAGGITAAVENIRTKATPDLKIEVEVRNLTELQEAAALEPDRIMLDNMAIAEMQEAVRFTGGRIPLEASGNVSLDTVRAIAATGVDYISVGSLTHSVQALDISLLLSPA